MMNHQFRRALSDTTAPVPLRLPPVTASDGNTLNNFTKQAAGPNLYIALGIVALSCLIYAPFLKLPLLPDDYLQITLARQWGPMSEWGALLEDHLFRNRATSLIVTYWTDLFFPLSRLAFGTTSILLHAMNGLLVYSLGTVRRIGWQLSAIVAIVFVLQERHHEAVIWYAALPELLVFFFGLLSLLLWVRWLRSPAPAIATWSGVLASFVLATVSKESAVAVIFLMIIVTLLEGASMRRVILGLAPLALVAGLEVVWIFLGTNNHHFADGTFVLQSGFFNTLFLSAGRGLWIWGFVGLVALMFLGVRHHLLLLAAGCWIAVALLPYSFLTYAETAPSRHHYLAGVGYSMIAALALQRLLDRTRNTRLVAGCLLVIGLHHTTYLWTSKYRQFERRSEPIEAFIRFLNQESRRPIVVHCSDYYFAEVRRAAALRLGEDRANIVLDMGEVDAHKPSYCLSKPL